jgi:hypothetical protein
LTYSGEDVKRREPWWSGALKRLLTREGLERK